MAELPVVVAILIFSSSYVVFADLATVNDDRFVLLRLVTLRVVYDNVLALVFRPCIVKTGALRRAGGAGVVGRHSEGGVETMNNVTVGTALM